MHSQQCYVLQSDSYVFQCNRVVCRVTQISLNFFHGISYDQVLQVCIAVCFCKTDIIVDKVEKNVYPLMVFHWFPLKFGIARWKFNGAPFCGFQFEIGLKRDSFCLYFSSWLKLVAFKTGPIWKLIPVF